MPSSEAAWTRDPPAAICSSRSILPGPSGGPPGSKRIRRRISRVGLDVMRSAYRGPLARADRIGVSICPPVHIGTRTREPQMIRKFLCAALAVCIQLGSAAIARAADPELLVFGAASLTNVLDALGPAYTKESG